MKKIAVEEHIWMENLKPFLETRKDFTCPENGEEKKSGTPPEMIAKLLDIEKRLELMDRYDVQMQVLSSTLNLAPYGPEGVAAACTFNDGLAALTRKYPERFAALATFSAFDPPAAATELERSVRELDMKGAMVPSSISAGQYWDNGEYRVIFQKAHELDVPIYIHPTYVSPDMIKAFSPYTQLYGDVWGFAADTGLAAMRLICSGIFDDLPDLKIILGHLGEALPYWLWRIDNRWEKRKLSTAPGIKRLLKKPGQYIKDNFYITTSGMLYEPALECAIKSVGIDRIMFALDYPWEPLDEGAQFIDGVQINDRDKEKICFRNAQALLHL